MVTCSSKVGRAATIGVVTSSDNPKEITGFTFNTSSGRETIKFVFNIGVDVSMDSGDKVTELIEDVTSPKSLLYSCTVAVAVAVVNTVR